MAERRKVPFTLFSADLFTIADAFSICHRLGFLCWQSNGSNSTKPNARFSHIDSSLGFIHHNFAPFLYNVSNGRGKSENNAYRYSIDRLSNCHVVHSHRYVVI